MKIRTDIAAATLGIALCAGAAYLSIQRWSVLEREAEPVSDERRMQELAALEQIYLAEGLEGKDSHQVLDRLSNLSLVSWQLGHFQQSQTALNKALAISQTRWGKDAPQSAVYLAALASLYRDWGKIKNAQSAAERVLSIDTKAFGESSNYVCRDLNNAGLLYIVDAQNQSDEKSRAELLAKGRNYLEKSASIKKRLHQSLPPAQDAVLVNMVSLLSQEGRGAEASRLHQSINNSRSLLKKYQAP